MAPSRIAQEDMMLTMPTEIAMQVVATMKK
jgi:hypothetical protein